MKSPEFQDYLKAAEEMEDYPLTWETVGQFMRLAESNLEERLEKKKRIKELYSW